MARGVKLPTELIAGIQAELLTGESVRAVSIKYGVHENTVQGWKNRLNMEDLVAVRAKRQEEIEEKLHTYKLANLDALTAQANLAATLDYLSRVPAQQLAILHGVMADKIARLSETHEPTAGTTGREDAPSAGEAVPEPEEGSEPPQSFPIDEYDDTTSTSASSPLSTEGD